MIYCPFWSNKKIKVKCYIECPINECNTNEECIFLSYLSPVKVHSGNNKEKFNVDKNYIAI